MISKNLIAKIPLFLDSSMQIPDGNIIWNLAAGEKRFSASAYFTVRAGPDADPAFCSCSHFQEGGEAQLPIRPFVTYREA
jgi:hypothetical protein